MDRHQLKGGPMLNFKTFRLCLLACLLSLLFSPPSYSEELNNWPRNVKVSSGTITIYQPQVESLEGDTLKARTAIAYHASGSDSPVFGAAIKSI